MTKDMKVTNNHTNKWKSNSIKIARKLSYNKNILDFLDKNVKLEINKSKIPKGMWYGRAHYDPKSPKVEIYEKNLSCENIPAIINELKGKGVPEKTLKQVSLLLRIVPRKIFFDVYNQSGMDHELIGHIYNNFAKKGYGEKPAVEVQMEFAKKRSGWFIHKLPWKVISVFAPIILYHHKKDQF